jgi:NAD-dependent deacetylase
VVLFGEPIPWLAQEQAEEEAGACGVLLVIGTSAQVSPACDIPRIAKETGAAVIEINPEPTSLTASVKRFRGPPGTAERDFLGGQTAHLPAFSKLTYLMCM